jgi:hypothetical protein
MIQRAKEVGANKLPLLIHGPEKKGYVSRIWPLRLGGIQSKLDMIANQQILPVFPHPVPG